MHRVRVRSVLLYEVGATIIVKYGDCNYNHEQSNCNQVSEVYNHVSEVYNRAVVKDWCPHQCLVLGSMC